MIGKQFKYKNLDFTDAYQKGLQRDLGYSYPLQNNEFDIASRSEKFDNINYHGGFLSKALYGIRYFNFQGIAIGTSKDKRGEVRKLLQKELNLAYSSEYFSLERQTDDGLDRTCKARVEIPLKGSNDLSSPLVPYTFQLASPSEKFYSKDIYSHDFGLGAIGGVALATSLSSPISGYSGFLKIDNMGNWQAPIKLSIIGKCTNPQIINITNNTNYRLDHTSYGLIYDNRNEDFSANDLIVEDLGQSVKNKRISGGHIYLDPGINRIVVLSDDPTETPEINLLYRDTFV